MAEELEGLLTRIQNDAVSKAEQQAGEIVAKAREKAATIVKEADQKARQSLEQAEKDAGAFMERSRKTLEQAARDLIITVGGGVEELFERLVKDAVGEALTADVVADLIGTLCKSFASDAVSVEVSPAEQEKVLASFKAKFSAAVKDGGVEIKSNNEIIKGFTVGVKGQDVYTDFTGEAIAEALMKFLRPQLAEIVREVAGRK